MPERADPKMAEVDAPNGVTFWEPPVSPARLLRDAAKGGDLARVQQLIQEGVDPTVNNCDALNMAALYGHLPIVRYLVGELGDRLTLERLQKVFCCAADTNKLDVLRYVIDLDRNVVAADNGYALYWSAYYGHIDAVKLLLKEGADVRSGNGRDALSGAVSEGGDMELITCLLEAGADVHVDNDLPLRCAAQNGDVAVAKRLVEAGADVRANDDVALRWAAYAGRTEMVAYLLQLGVPVTPQALKNATERNHSAILALFEQHQA